MFEEAGVRGRGRDGMKMWSEGYGSYRGRIVVEAGGEVEGSSTVTEVYICIAGTRRLKRRG